MSKRTKKAVSPNSTDSWLDGLGFYRKNVASDETCLFRAISEQLYSSQIYHQKCRQQLINYVKENWEQFEFILTKNELFKHLDLLENHMVVCGELEIQMISKTFKRNIIIFKANSRSIKKIYHEEFEDTLRLCLIGNDHYDAVYNKDYIQSAGFCQSIAYNLLYEKVFGMKELPEIVDTMLNSTIFIASNNNNNNIAIKDEHTHGKNLNKPHKSNKNKDLMVQSEYDNMLETKIIPFPFRVAKSLDPNIYRNIEYDTWIEMKKEMRLRSWYYGDENLTKGTKCLLKSSEGTLQCYIQDLEKDNDQCVVYITNLAEKRVVKYTDLTPEPDAKPWPLPYRFSARSNAPISLSNEVISSNDLNNHCNNVVKVKKEVVKRQIVKGDKNGKKNQGKIGNRNVPPLTLSIKTDLYDNNVKGFEESPLHMQTPLQSLNEPTILEYQTSTQYQFQTSTQYQPQTSTQYQPQTSTQYQPQTLTQYQPQISTQYQPQTSTQYQPQTSTQYQPQTFFQNQPSWLDQISFEEQQLCSEITTLYNISQDSLFSSPPQIPQWPVISDQQPQENIPQPSPVVLLPPSPYPNYFDQQIHHSQLIPVTPLPLYQPVYQNTAVTPLIYTPSQDCAACGQEVLVMSPQTADSYSRMFPSGYNPPIDMSFLSSPFVFPPAETPNEFYGAPIDAQGFVFPTPITPQE